MVTTDVHAHITLPAGLEAMAAAHPGTVPRLVEEEAGFFFHFPNGAVNGPVPPGMVSIPQRRADMARSGVDRQIVSLRPQLFKYDLPASVAGELAAIQNDALVEAATQQRDVLHAMVTLPLHVPDTALAELERHRGNPIVRGVLVDSNIAGRNLDDPDFADIWAALEEADLPVLVHPFQADVAGQERLGDYYLFNLIGNPMDSTIALASVIFGGLIDRHPTLRWCFVHGGGYAPYQLGRWDHGWAQREVARVNIAERKPSDYFRTLYFDSLTHDGAALRFLAGIVGWDRILLGSDYPFDMGDHDCVSGVHRLGLGAETEDGVLSANAERFLRPVWDT